MGYVRAAPRTYSKATDGADLLRCLANGRAPAARFATDLADLESLARSRPAGDGRASGPAVEAEREVRLARLEERNRCAEECGSYVFTDLSPITWTATPTAGGAGRGMFEGIAFTATPERGGWSVASEAC